MSPVAVHAGSRADCDADRESRVDPRRKPKRSRPSRPCACRSMFRFPLDPRARARNSYVPRRKRSSSTYATSWDPLSSVGSPCHVDRAGRAHLDFAPSEAGVAVGGIDRDSQRISGIRREKGELWRLWIEAQRHRYRRVSPPAGCRPRPPATHRADTRPAAGRTRAAARAHCRRSGLPVQGRCRRRRKASSARASPERRCSGGLTHDAAKPFARRHAVPPAIIGQNRIREACCRCRHHATAWS